MKKFLAAVLAAVMTVSLAGCQTNNDTSEKSAESALSSAEVSAVKDMYNFYDYESDEIVYIDEVEINDSLKNLCRTYEFSFMSDGYQIQAYISFPKSATETQQPCKCILYSRGGNSNYGNLDKNMISYVSAYSNRIAIGCELRGCNGSEGYDQFGGDELNDTIKLIDLCENYFPFADMEDFCAMGGSRGGMMTYMAARRDDRIKRIIVFSGISDLFTSYEYRDDMKEGLGHFIGGTPEEMPEEYEKRSAVCWADEIKVPVLLIHSKKDAQVSFAEAEKIYSLLKDKTDCTFITYEDDLHGLHDEDIPIIAEWLEKK